MVGHPKRDPLEEQEHLADDTPSSGAVDRVVHFRGEIMVIEDDPLSRQLCRQCRRPERIRRIVEMDHVESSPDQHAKDHHERCGGGVQVLDEIRPQARTGRWRRVPSHMNSINRLGPRPTVSVRRDDRDVVAGRRERQRFQPDSRVGRVPIVLDHHQDAGSHGVVGADRLHRATSLAERPCILRQCQPRRQRGGGMPPFGGSPPWPGWR